MAGFRGCIRLEDRWGEYDRPRRTFDVTRELFEFTFLRSIYNRVVIVFDLTNRNRQLSTLIRITLTQQISLVGPTPQLCGSIATTLPFYANASLCGRGDGYVYDSQIGT